MNPGEVSARRLKAGFKELARGAGRCCLRKPSASNRIKLLSMDLPEARRKDLVIRLVDE